MEPLPAEALADMMLTEPAEPADADPLEMATSPPSCIPDALATVTLPPDTPPPPLVRFTSPPAASAAPALIVR